MHAKPYTKKEFEKLLINNGFFLQRVKGSHFIYRNGTDLISVSKNLNKMISHRLIKEYHLAEVS